MSQSSILEQAVILAGGLGSRLGELTATKPKSLVDVNGKPFMEHQLKMLARHDIRQVLILTGYRGEQIEEAFGSGSQFGLKLTYCREIEALGTGGALAHAKEQLPDLFFLVYGDAYVDCDYQAAARAYLNWRIPGPAGLMITFAAGAGNDDPGNAMLDPTGTKVVSYHKGHGGDHDYVDAGVLILTSDVIQLLPPRKVSALEEYVYPCLAAQDRLMAFPSPARFHDIGTPERLSAFASSIDAGE